MGTWHVLSDAHCRQYGRGGGSHQNAPAEHARCSSTNRDTGAWWRRGSSSSPHADQRARGVDLLGNMCREPPGH